MARRNEKMSGMPCQAFFEIVKHDRNQNTIFTVSKSPTYKQNQAFSHAAKRKNIKGVPCPAIFEL